VASDDHLLHLRNQQRLINGDKGSDLVAGQLDIFGMVGKPLPTGSGATTKDLMPSRACLPGRLVPVPACGRWPRRGDSLCPVRSGCARRRCEAPEVDRRQAL